MNYKSEIDMISKFMDLAESNAQNYRAGDTSRCYYTDGMMQGLTYALKAGGHQVEYLTYIGENGCPRPVSLTVDGHELIKDSAIQFEALKEYKQSLLPVTKVTVYQISSDRDSNHVSFLSQKNLQQFQGSPEVDSSIYDRVYTGELHCSSLENIYQILNVDHPSDYRARSLSVSDVVQIEDSPLLEKGFYFCDSTEFRSIRFEPAKTLDGPFYGEEAVPQGKVLVIEPEGVPEQKEMSLDLSSLQKAVGGYIEAVYPFDDTVAIIVREEGKLNGLPFNRALRDDQNDIYEVTAGTMLVVGVDDDNFSGLSQEQLQKYETLFHDPEQFQYIGGQLVATKLQKTNAKVQVPALPEKKLPERTARKHSRKHSEFER